MSDSELTYFKFDKDTKLVTETSANMFESGVISKANEDEKFLTTDLDGSLQFTTIDLDTLTTESYDVAATEIEATTVSSNLYGYFAVGNHEYSTDGQLEPSGLV